MAQSAHVGSVSALWRRALEALAHAFDPARYGDGEDTVFQTRRARPEPAVRLVAQRDERDPAAGRPPEETLQ